MVAVQSLSIPENPPPPQIRVNVVNVTMTLNVVSVTIKLLM